LVTASNNYFRNAQFQELERAAANKETAAVLRDNMVQQVHPKDLVVGDIIILNVRI
jgi:magnesium-transporting ATPase (P-type)